ncbi:MAG: tetratricopeptide repeat protein [Spirochaetaceae bacterium]|jgi:ppGpp synthetase/RelA/SpoT-type nucleotidyltranferase|nr:tetratricopeptide repeat protein [Spirochaetaceae bacterium]
MSGNSLSATPDKKKILAHYQAFAPMLEHILAGMVEKIRGVVTLASPPTYKARLKSFSNYYKKLLNLKIQGMAVPGGDFPLTTDILGIRVICVFLEDLNAVVEQVKNALEVVEVERKGVEQKFFEFGYESIHLLVRIPPDVLAGAAALFPGTMSRPDMADNFLCEIQVRTILQDAWAEAEHDLVYKSEFSPFGLPLRRKLASINASLNLADTLFQEIRDYQTRLHSEIGHRRQSFYSKADALERKRGMQDETDSSGEQHTLPLAAGLLVREQQSAEPAADVEPSVGPFLRGSIDELILDAIHSHNLGEYKTAVDIYTRIIDFDPRPTPVVLSVIYKHRGMAHFSRNDFQSALADFIQSIALNDQNAQSHYYSGIVHSLLGDNEKAAACFAKSLEINPFQAHTYYRKALAEYALGEYEAAMISLEQALKLGLEDQDVQRLHRKLLQKFQMKF